MTFFKQRKPTLKTNGMPRIPASLVVIFSIVLGSLLASSCKKEKKVKDVSHDPLPGELVEDILRTDSILDAQKDVVKDTMSKVLAEYSKKHNNPAQTSYFTTDLDNDKVPELWIKNTNAIGEPRIELYYPMKDGSLKQSEVPVRNGDLYLGDDFVMLVMRGDPGKILIKELSIVNGVAELHVMKELDLALDPTLKNFTVGLPSITTAALSNLGPLNAAFEISFKTEMPALTPTPS